MYGNSGPHFVFSPPFVLHTKLLSWNYSKRKRIFTPKLSDWGRSCLIISHMQICVGYIRQMSNKYSICSLNILKILRNFLNTTGSLLGFTLAYIHETCLTLAVFCTVILYHLVIPICWCLCSWLESSWRVKLYPVIYCKLYFHWWVALKFLPLSLMMLLVKNKHISTDTNSIKSLTNQCIIRTSGCLYKLFSFGLKWSDH